MNKSNKRICAMTLIFSCDCKSNTNVVIQPIYKCQLLRNKSIISICLDSCINIFSFVSIIIPFIPHTNMFDVLDIFQNKIIIFMHWIFHLWSVRNYIVMLIINFTWIYFISFLNILNFSLWNIDYHVSAKGHVKKLKLLFCQPRAIDSSIWVCTTWKCVITIIFTLLKSTQWSYGMQVVRHDLQPLCVIDRSSDFGQLKFHRISHNSEVIISWANCTCYVFTNYKCCGHLLQYPCD